MVYTNHLEKLLNLFPYQSWDWDSLSDNPNITWEFVQDEPDRPWNPDILGRNPNVTWDAIVSNQGPTPNTFWDWEYVSMNPNITEKIVLDNLDRPWDWFSLSRNENISWQTLSTYSDMNLDFYSLSTHPGITWDIVRQNIGLKWVWSKLSENRNITWEIIHDNPDPARLATGLAGLTLTDLDRIKWDYTNFCSNPNVTFDFVLTHPNPFPSGNYWEWSRLSEKINIDVIRNNPGPFPSGGWDFYWVSTNPSLTWDFIQENPQHMSEWNWVFLSLHHNITPEIVRSHPDPSVVQDCRGWSWEFFQHNPNITWEIVKDNLVDPKRIFGIVDKTETDLYCTSIFGPSTRNVGQWDWAQLSKNSFEKNPHVFRRKVEKYEKIGEKLVPFQRKWIDWYYNPRNTNMVRRLEESYEEMRFMH